MEIEWKLGLQKVALTSHHSNSLGSQAVPMLCMKLTKLVTTSIIGPPYYGTHSHSSCWVQFKANPKINFILYGVSQIATTKSCFLLAKLMAGTRMLAYFHSTSTLPPLHFHPSTILLRIGGCRVPHQWLVGRVGGPLTVPWPQTCCRASHIIFLSTTVRVAMAQL